MKFKPCIDIHEGKVKQIVGSSLGSKLTANFVSQRDSAYYANIYRKDNLLGGHVIMLDSSPATRDEAFRALQVFKNGLQIGGGITASNAFEYIEAGAQKVIISSALFNDGQLNYDSLKKIVKVLGPDKLVLDLSCRYLEDCYYAMVDKWQTCTNFAITKENLEELSVFCSEFLIHSVDLEGKRQGVDDRLLKILNQIKGAAITYAGGVKDFNDLEKIKQYGQGKINFTIGSALDIFGGELSYRQVVRYVNKLKY